jgi:6-pyruvoyl-tetrahydropterin synthase
MYAVEVREHVMIAHSFRGEMFGPAQALHGATFVVDVAFFCPSLTKEGVVIDIGLAHAALKEVLAPLNYRNLDEDPAFTGKNTTTEYLAFHIFEAINTMRKAGKLGEGAQNLTKMRVMLHESHIARGWYEADLA